MSEVGTRKLPRTGAPAGTRLLRRFEIVVGDSTFGYLMRPALAPYVKRLPALPRRLRAGFNPHRGAWPTPVKDIPASLQTVPGIRRNPEAEEHAYEESPLRDFVEGHSVATLWVLRRLWRTLLPIIGFYRRAQEAVNRTPAAVPAAAHRLNREQLTSRIKSDAARVGLSAVGITGYDPKYVLEEYRGQQDMGSVIVCLLEQNYEATQTAPSVRAERATFAAYSEVMDLAAELAKTLHREGYRAHAHTIESHMVVIPYAVAAGLGQLGINGQLLTPKAGSRVRITVITTNAELVEDKPVDYGVEAICDACRVCARRCPVGAIPASRKEYRGVVKSKLSATRCMPVVAQADGCAICMKVCPVQRYGLDAVRETYVATGEILGKDTDELEGFHWPLDGRHYGPGEKPRINSKALLNPPGWEW